MINIQVFVFVYTFMYKRFEKTNIKHISKTSADQGLVLPSVDLPLKNF